MQPNSIGPTITGKYSNNVVSGDGINVKAIVPITEINPTIATNIAKLLFLILNGLITFFSVNRSIIYALIKNTKGIKNAKVDIKINMFNADATLGTNADNY